MRTAILAILTAILTTGCGTEPFYPDGLPDDLLAGQPAPEPGVDRSVWSRRGGYSIPTGQGQRIWISRDGRAATTFRSGR